jgi:hypothetical protein
MIEKDNNIESIFSYKDGKGERYWTPNGLLAHARAEALGTNSVWVENYEVPPLPEKKS